MRSKLFVAFAILITSLVGTPAPLKAADIHLGLYDESASVSIIGRIEAGDADRFMQVLRQGVAARGYVPVVNIFSPGGAVNDALAIGEVISTLSMTTNVPFRTDEVTQEHSCRYRETGANEDTVLSRNFVQGSGDRTCTCMSACFLIWAAGAERSGHFIGIHRTYFRPEVFAATSFADARERFANVRLNVEDYLRRMNVPDLVIDTMYSVASDQIEPLDQEFIDLLRADPALEEYLNARCQDVFIVNRDAEREVARLDRLAEPTLEDITARAAALLASIEAGQALFDCQREVRRTIFAEAWMANYAQAGDAPVQQPGGKN